MLTPHTELQQNRGQSDGGYYHQRQRTEKRTWAGVKNHHRKSGAEQAGADYIPAARAVLRLIQFHLGSEDPL
jgi:hypothetical protein